MLARPVRMASVSQAMSQLRKPVFIARFQNALLRSHAKNDFLGAEKRSWNAPQSRARELQPAPAKSNFGRRQNGYFAIRQDRLNSRDRFPKAPARRFIVGGMH